MPYLCHNILFYICLRFFLSVECSLFVWIVSVFLFYNFFSSNSDIISHIVYIFYIRVSSVTQYEVIITVTRLVGSAVSTSSQFIVKTHQHSTIGPWDTFKVFPDLRISWLHCSVWYRIMYLNTSWCPLVWLSLENNWEGGPVVYLYSIINLSWGVEKLCNIKGFKYRCISMMYLDNRFMMSRKCNLWPCQRI